MLISYNNSIHPLVVITSKHFIVVFVVHCELLMKFFRDNAEVHAGMLVIVKNSSPPPTVGRLSVEVSCSSQLPVCFAILLPEVQYLESLNNVNLRNFYFFLILCILDP